MSFETELVSLLQANSAVLATVGERIWPVAVRAQLGFPAITYARQEGSREYTLDTSVVRQAVVVVVRCWAREYPTARGLAEAVAAALDRETTGLLDVITVRDGADVWLEGHEVFGCTLVMTMETFWEGGAVEWAPVRLDFTMVLASQYVALM